MPQPLRKLPLWGLRVHTKSYLEKKFAAAEDPVQEAKLRADEYAEKFATPYVAATKGYIDAVIFPEETRSYLSRVYRHARTSDTRQ